MTSIRARRIFDGSHLCDGGTVIVERIFSYPGIGNMAVDAVINRDLPLIQGLTLVFGALFIVVNIVVDMLVVVSNPRLRNG